MLSSGNRLRSPHDFRQVVRLGKRSGGSLLVVHLGHDPEADAPRVGFVVAKTVGPAVTRTLVKRRLRHLVRERLVGLPGSSLLVVRAQPAAGAASYEELGAALDRCLRKVLG